MRTPEFERRVAETLEQHGLLLVAIAKALGDQQTQMQTTNERLERLVELLTPEESEKVKKRASFVTRTLWTFIMIGGFISEWIPV